MHPFYSINLITFKIEIRHTQKMHKCVVYKNVFKLEFIIWNCKMERGLTFRIKEGVCQPTLQSSQLDTFLNCSTSNFLLLTKVSFFFFRFFLSFSSLFILSLFQFFILLSFLPQKLQKRFSEGNINCNAIKYKETKASVTCSNWGHFYFRLFQDWYCHKICVCLCVWEREKER